ncbi:MAG: fluoride efflux transporter CrcB [Candidatus Nitrohelix vancouverensis]|uniref:Fluoride-specific ion channel FluC n=1 Tax=Candidatus Nitrohelix vancouverensis TaxID=2705534 RepID=A0A7T0G4C0_9BACT|nr:MAG: fluoride efflux transporter CrcB [Candidatus Nitrohelix vancouverensis]
MPLWIYIGLGGFAGSLFRYWVSGWVQSGFLSFPAGTLFVNFVGSFLLGFVMFLSESKGMFSDEIRIFLSIGVLGAFTTMSTFSYESFRLLQQDQLVLFTVNILATVILSLIGIYLGKVIAYL